MAITAVLVESTPERLRYLLTQDGVISSPPVPADGAITIPNDGGVTPDLLTDASAGPLRQIINVRATGYPPNPTSGAPVVPVGGVNQAQARALFMSDDNPAAPLVLTNDLVGRAIATVAPRLGAINWTVDANVDMQADPVLLVTSDVGVAATAYLDLYFRHTYDL